MNCAFKQANDWASGPAKQGVQGCIEKIPCISCFKYDFLLHLHSFNEGPFV